ncbi:hypothetical protein GCM10020367_55220 [Streptomyces sannanensis]|uniref:Transposase n=1 Tax=Streptomyces sannanensis TaxID=285536 RepID=A0ABP6SK05_9ACTN
MVAESLLQLLETGGEDAFLDAVLSGGRSRAEDAIRAALTSGHPDHTGLEQLRRFAQGPPRAKSAQLGRLNAARARGRTKPKGKRRREASRLITVGGRESPCRPGHSRRPSAAARDGAVRGGR